MIEVLERVVSSSQLPPSNALWNTSLLCAVGSVRAAVEALTGSGLVSAALGAVEQLKGTTGRGGNSDYRYTADEFIQLAEYLRVKGLQNKAAKFAGHSMVRLANTLYHHALRVVTSAAKASAAAGVADGGDGAGDEDDGTAGNGEEVDVDNAHSAIVTIPLTLLADSSADTVATAFQVIVPSQPVPFLDIFFKKFLCLIHYLSLY